MTTWNDIIDIDGRVAQIADASVNLVAVGEQHRDFPDAVYTEAKRYLNALVGFGRGGAVTPSRLGYRDDYSAPLSTPLDRPAPAVTTEQDRMLRHPDTYQLVCTHVYDRLCQMYDWRHRWAA